MKTTTGSPLAPRCKPSIIVSAIALVASLGPAASFACTHTQAIGPATTVQREAVPNGTQEAPFVASVPAGHNVGIYEWNNSQQAYLLTSSWHDPYIIDQPPQWDETDVTDVLFGGAAMTLNSNCDPSRIEEITVTAIANSNWRSSGIIAFSLRPGLGAGGTGPRWFFKPQFRRAETRMAERDCPASDDYPAWGQRVLRFRQRTGRLALTQQPTSIGRSPTGTVVDETGLQLERWSARSQMTRVTVEGRNAIRHPRLRPPAPTRNVWQELLMSLRKRTLVVIALVVVAALPFFGTKTEDSVGRPSAIRAGDSSALALGATKPSSDVDAASIGHVQAKQRARPSRGGAQENPRLLPIEPYTAPTAQAALAALDRLPVGHPERERVLTSLLLLCNRQGLRDTDAAFDSWATSGWVARTEESRQRFEQWVADRRTYCAGIDESRIEPLYMLEVSAKRASTSDDALMALLQTLADGTWRLASDSRQQEVDDLRLLSALGRLENQAQIVAKPEVERELWRMLLESASPTVAETAVPLLVNARSGPMADASSHFAPSAPPGMPWREKPDVRASSVLSAVAAISICRRLGHCGPGSLRSLGMGPDNGGLAARDGVEGRLRDALSPEEWRLVNLFLARVDEHGRSRAVR